MGARLLHLALLLLKDFGWSIALAMLIALPLGAWAMHSWLEGFAYRTPIGAWIFIGAGMLAVLIALLTVGLRAIQAAQSNPVKSLKTE